MNRPSATPWWLAALISVGCSCPAPQATGTTEPTTQNTGAPPTSAPTTPSPSADTQNVGSEPSIPFEGTVGIIDVPRQTNAATLVSVRAASHTGFDRVVFELGVTDAIPGYHLEYIDKPVRDCGEGSAKEIAGDAWLEVRMHPANAHTEAGQPTIAFREQALELQVLRELERTCDFEAVTTWVLGVRSPNAYRVQELSNPPRLVIDIAASR